MRAGMPGWLDISPPPLPHPTPPPIPAGDLEYRWMFSNSKRRLAWPRADCKNAMRQAQEAVHGACTQWGRYGPTRPLEQSCMAMHMESKWDSGARGNYDHIRKWLRFRAMQGLSCAQRWTPHASHKEGKENIQEAWAGNVQWGKCFPPCAMPTWAIMHGCAWIQWDSGTMQVRGGMRSHHDVSEMHGDARNSTGKPQCASQGCIGGHDAM